MSIKGYNIHIFSMAALFTLGNAIITMPFYQTANPVYIFISTVFSLVLVLITALIIKTGSKNKVIFAFLSLLVGVTAIHGFLTALFDYINFIKTVQMPRTSVILITLALLFAVFIFALCSGSAIYKYCLLVATVCAVLVALNFFGGFKAFDYSQAKAIFKQPVFFTNDLFRYFSSLSTIILFVFFSRKKTAVKAVSFGVATGFFVLALCFTQSVFTLGLSHSAEYPYIRAISVISSGSLFTRLDGFVYFIFFATCFVKSGICVKTVILIFKNIFYKKRTEGA